MTPESRRLRIHAGHLRELSVAEGADASDRRTGYVVCKALYDAGGILLGAAEQLEKEEESRCVSQKP